MRFDVYGMSCAACSARVEKAVSEVRGVTVCEVNLLANSLRCEGDFSEADVIEAVEKAGYTAEIAGVKKTKKQDKTEEKQKLRRLIISAAILLPLLYLTLGNMIFSLPIGVLSEKIILLGLIEMLLSGVIIVINRSFFISGVRAVFRRAPNMDTLISLGSGISFLYSIINLAASAAKGSSPKLYFESAAMILVLISVGKLLEARAKSKTSDSLSELKSLIPDFVTVRTDGTEKKIPSSEVKKGDIIVLRSGFAVPSDGILISGSCFVNEAAMSGESLPVQKNTGNEMTAGTTVLSGYAELKTERAGAETKLSGIIEFVENAGATKAPVARLADKVAGIFVSVVIGISALTFIINFAVSHELSAAINRAVSVLVVSCPCALGLATPVAVTVGMGRGARDGILFKNAEVLENAAAVKTAVFDKTGTLTRGFFTVTDMKSYNDDFLKNAVSLESLSSHPLALSVCRFGGNIGIEPLPVDGFTETQGRGVSGIINGTEYFGGNYEYISSVCNINPDAEEFAKNSFSDGKTVLFFASKCGLLGALAMSDELREGAAETFSALKALGIKTVILSGDSEGAVRAAAEKSGADEYRFGMLPLEKAAEIERLKKFGKVMMTGDGVNDAPALTKSDVSVAAYAGTDVAADGADIVLMRDGIEKTAGIITLGRRTMRIIRQNLFWAFAYNILMIPLAAGLFGGVINPVLSAAAMSLSSFIVCMNALRLGKTKQKDTEEIKIMTKTFSVEGMMCIHCEARVKQTLEALDGVISAAASHESGTVTVTLSRDIPDEIIKAAITAQGYKVK